MNRDRQHARLFLSLVDGLTRKDIRDLLSRNGRKDDIERALNLIADAGLAEGRRVPNPDGGPTPERWRVTT
jgi:hypothetical protein